MSLSRLRSVCAYPEQNGRCIATAEVTSPFGNVAAYLTLRLLTRLRVVDAVSPMWLFRERVDWCHWTVRVEFTRGTSSA